MSPSAWLAPLAPCIAGEWRALGYALVALPLCLSLWAALGRRWRPDGVRRCTKCSHEFDPAERFGRTEGVRCTECGHMVRNEAAALARRGRAWIFAAGIVASFLVSLPLLAWHNAHIFLARALLPRWVAVQRADFPNGLSLAEEVDPVQEILRWEPNPDGRAWDANFYDAVDKGLAMWPDRRRLRAWTDAARPSVTSYLGPFTFGAVFRGDDGNGTMPPVGAPGFGSDVNGDGQPDVIVGEMNPGSGGGVTWMRITLPEEAAQDGGPSFSVVGMGSFRRDEAHGDWVFMSTCHGFHYMFAPGTGGVKDPEILCTWDPLRRNWVPDPSRMRREPDRVLLSAAAAQAAGAWDECVRSIAELKDGGARDREDFPCAGVIAQVVAGVMEMVTSGHGAEWEGWVRVAWPPGAGTAERDRFVARMRRALEMCECADALRELGAVPSARKAPQAATPSAPR